MNAEPDLLVVEHVEELFPHWNRMPPIQNVWHETTVQWHFDDPDCFVKIFCNNKFPIEYELRISTQNKSPDGSGFGIARKGVNWLEFTGEVNSFEELQPLIAKLLKFAEPFTSLKGSSPVVSASATRGELIVALVEAGHQLQEVVNLKREELLKLV
jgi:hypothetical protein